MKDVLIGIDAGTSVIKSIAFSTDGEQIAVASLPNRYETFDDFGVEQDMTRTWRDTVATLYALAEKVPDLARRTAAIAITGQGDGTWLIDAEGEAVTGGWLWLDARARRLVEAMRERPADRKRFELTGTGLNACQQGMQLLWMKRNRPGLLDRAATAFHCKDWLYFKATGERVTDPSEGTFTFGDFRSRSYSDAVLDDLGLASHASLLPPMLEGTTDRFPLTAKAARETGLLEGTPVVLGYVDVICTALGAGLYDPKGAAGCTIIGSTGMHMRLARSPDEVVLNADSSGYTMPMPIPGVYAQMQSNMAATLNIDWFLGVAGELLAAEGVERSRHELISLLDAWVKETRPGSVIFQPYISKAGERGPFVDANARAGFIGLSIGHGFGDMGRAVLEGLAYAARDCYQAMGTMPDEVRLSGGASRSRSLRRILGAALRAKTRTSEREEAGAAGAAMMAAVSLGIYETMDACVAEWVTPLLGESEPFDTELAAIYDRAYPAFAEAHVALRPVWKTLAKTEGA